MRRDFWLNLFIFLFVLSLSIRFGIRLLIFGLRFWYITLPIFLIYYYLIKPKEKQNNQHVNHHQNRDSREIYIDPKDYKTTEIDEDENIEN